MTVDIDKGLVAIFLPLEVHKKDRAILRLRLPMYLYESIPFAVNDAIVCLENIVGKDRVCDWRLSDIIDIKHQQSKFPASRIIADV